MQRVQVKKEMDEIKNELKAIKPESLATVQQELEALTNEIRNNNSEMASLRGRLEEKIKTIGTEKSAFTRFG